MSKKKNLNQGKTEDPKKTTDPIDAMEEKQEEFSQMIADINKRGEEITDVLNSMVLSSAQASRGTLLDKQETRPIIGNETFEHMLGEMKETVNELNDIDNEKEKRFAEGENTLENLFNQAQALSQQMGGVGKLDKKSRKK